jgi:hypothetical protein
MQHPKQSTIDRLQPHISSTFVMKCVRVDGPLSIKSIVGRLQHTIEIVASARELSNFTYTVGGIGINVRSSIIMQRIRHCVVNMLISRLGMDGDHADRKEQ